MILLPFDRVSHPSALTRRHALASVKFFFHFLFEIYLESELLLRVGIEGAE